MKNRSGSKTIKHKAFSAQRRNTLRKGINAAHKKHGGKGVKLTVVKAKTLSDAKLAAMWDKMHTKKGGLLLGGCGPCPACGHDGGEY